MVIKKLKYKYQSCVFLVCGGSYGRCGCSKCKSGIVII